MEYKYCLVVLISLAATHWGDCFVLSNTATVTNSNAEEPAVEITEVSLTPTAISLTSDGDSLQNQEREYVVTTKAIKPGVEDDTENTTTAIEGINHTGHTRPSNEVLKHVNVVKLVTLVTFSCAATLCFMLLMYLVIKFFKRSMFNLICHLPSVSNNMEMSTIRYLKIKGEEAV